MKARLTSRILITACLIFAFWGFFSYKKSNPEDLGFHMAKIDDRGLIELVVDQIRQAIKSGNPDYIERVLSNNYIEEKESQLFSDEYDGMANCISYLTYCDDQPMGSIRACIYDPQKQVPIPVMEVFEKELRCHVGFDAPFLEANKFVLLPEFQHKKGIRADGFTIVGNKNLFIVER